jgi:hypothetical protein
MSGLWPGRQGDGCCQDAPKRRASLLQSADERGLSVAD